MTDAEFLVAEIIPSIPGYDEMTRLDAIQALTQYTFRHVPVSTGEATLLVLGPLMPGDLATLMPPFHNSQTGVWCTGAATMAARMIEASGKADKVWVYAYGLDRFLTHTVVLFELDGELYEQDPYFNTEFVDKHGRLIPYTDALAMIASDVMPRTKQIVASKKMIAQSQRNANDWVLPSERKILMYGKFDVTADPLDKYAMAPVTLKQFHDAYYFRQEIADELLRRKHPAPDWNYLHLYPIWVSAPYGQPSAWVENPGEEVDEALTLLETLSKCVKMRDTWWSRAKRRLRAALRVLRTL